MSSFVVQGYILKYIPKYLFKHKVYINVEREGYEENEETT